MEEYIITGGQVFFSNCKSQEMDIWIREGRIYYLDFNIGLKPNTKRFNASGYGIFPGLIYEQPLWQVLRNSEKYNEKMLELLHYGYTTFVDVMSWDGNLPISQLNAYYDALHNHTPLDYSLQLFISAQALTAEIVRDAGENLIRQLIISAKSASELQRLDWHHIIRCKERFGIFFWLYPGIQSHFGRQVKKQFEELVDSWYDIKEYFGFNSEIKSPNEFSNFYLDHLILFGDRFISKYSTLPAKRAGIFPRKGRIAPGSDADLLLVPLKSLELGSRFTPEYVFLGGKPFFIPSFKMPIGRGRRLNVQSTASYNYDSTFE